jgi:hypothetical protein
MCRWLIADHLENHWNHINTLSGENAVLGVTAGGRIDTVAMVLWIVVEWMEQLDGKNDMQSGTGPKLAHVGKWEMLAKF